MERKAGGLQEVHHGECALSRVELIAIPFLYRDVVKTKNYYTDMFGVPTHKRDHLTAAYQMSKVKSTLHQLIRDWSEEVGIVSRHSRLGQRGERAVLHPLIAGAREVCPIGEGRKRSGVSGESSSCPGSGQRTESSSHGGGGARVRRPGKRVLVPDAPGVELHAESRV